ERTSAGTAPGGMAAPAKGVGGRTDGSATGNTVGSANVISGNAGDGWRIESATGNVVAGNDIGTTAGPGGPLGNGANGVELVSGASGDAIGGTAQADANAIRSNAGAGVLVDGTSGDPILRNSISGNGGLGILPVPGWSGPAPPAALPVDVTRRGS